VKNITKESNREKPRNCERCRFFRENNGGLLVLATGTKLSCSWFELQRVKLYRK